MLMDEKRSVIMPGAVKKERAKQLNLSDESYETPAQLEALQSGNGELYEIIKKQLNTKLQGYRAQDTLKHMFVESEFMDMENTLRILKESDLRCFYCKECVKVLYRHVREGCQWTLERIDNDYGHVKTNVVIACLTCNLRRRTMYHERFAFTKQLVISKNN
jgi:RNase P subunit RPR2